MVKTLVEVPIGRFARCDTEFPGLESVIMNFPKLSSENRPLDWSV